MAEKLCPYCDEELGVFDLVYRLQAANESHEDSQLAEYLTDFQNVPSDQAIKRAKTFKYVSPLEIDFKGGAQPTLKKEFYKAYSADPKIQATSEVVIAACGKCHNIVPYNFDELGLFKVAVVGSYRTGKTTLLASMLKSLGGNSKWSFFTDSPVLIGREYNLADAETGSMFVDPKNPTIYQYYQMMFENLDEKPKLPGATTKDQMPYPFLFKLFADGILGKELKESRDTCVVLYDLPGELFAGEGAYLKLAIDRIESCDAIIWMVDPMNFPKIPLALNKKQDINKKSQEIANEYYTLIERINSRLGVAMNSKNIALVLTKADVLMDIKVKPLLNTGEANLSGDNVVFKKTLTDDEGEVNLRKIKKADFDKLIKKSDKDIKDAFTSPVFRFSGEEASSDGFAEHMETRLGANIKCFRASALGFDVHENEATVDSTGAVELPDNPKPYGLKDIFYWLFSESKGQWE